MANKIKYSGWWNFNHLRDAESSNGEKNDNIVKLYFIHMFIGFREAKLQFMLFVFSLLHAFFPFAFNFKLLEMVVNQTRGLYKFLPKHPIWKELKKELNDEK